MRKSELEGVKKGDKLICRHNYGGGFDVHVVERLTKTLAVCRDGAAFALDSGKKRGTNNWDARWARIPDAADLAEIELQNRIRAAKLTIENIKITADNLVAAEAFIAASQRKSDEGSSGL